MPEPKKKSFSIFDEPYKAPQSSDPEYDASSQFADFETNLTEVNNFSVNDLFNEAESNKKSESNITSDVKYANPDEVAKYTYQRGFDRASFDPFDKSNYEKWVGKETWTSALAKGFDTFGDKFSNTFIDYWKDYGRMINALVHFDMNRLTPDEQTMMELNLEERKNSMKNFVFVPKGTEDDIFSKRSISEFIGNSGYALGTFTAFATELMADALITIATEGTGSGSFELTFSRLFAKGGLKKIVGKNIGKEVAEEVGGKTIREGMKTTVKAEAKQPSWMSEFLKGTRTEEHALDKNIVSSAKKNLSDLKKATFPKRVQGKMMNDMSEIFSNKISNITKSKSFAEFADNILKGVPVIGQGYKYTKGAIKGSQAGKSSAEIIGLLWKGGRRMAQEYNMAATESSFEAITTYGDALEQMIKQHENITGRTVTAAELMKFKELAGNASFNNYGANLAILLATNKLQFGTLFNRFSVANKTTAELLDIIKSRPVKTVIPRFGKKLGRIYEKNFWGIYGNIGKISKEFGKKQAVYEIGKNFLKHFGKFEITEGLQENFQEMSASAWKNYYASRANGILFTLEDAFAKGASEQFTKQGFKTFLQGALTGTFISGPTHLMQTGMSKVQDYAIDRQYADKKDNPRLQVKEQRRTDISTVNEFMKSLEDGKAEIMMLNFDAQINASREQMEAAKEGKEYEFVNAKDNSLIATAMAANRLNTIDMFETSLRKMGEDMTDEEFKQEFKIDIKETKYSTPGAFINKVAKDVRDISDKVDAIRTKVESSLEDPSRYDKNSEEYQLAGMMRKTQEDFITLIAMNEVKASRASERSQKVINDYNAIPELAGSSDYIFRIMAQGNSITPELANISQEIGALQEQLTIDGLSAQQKKDIRTKIKDKKEEHKLLSQWLGYWSNREVIVRPATEDIPAEKTTKLDAFIGIKSGLKEKLVDKDGKETGEVTDVFMTKHKKVKDVFFKLLELKNKQAGNDVTLTRSFKEAEEGYSKVLDVIQLKQDELDYLNAIQSVYRPEIYKSTLLRMRNGLFKERLANALLSLKHSAVRSMNHIFMQSSIDENGKPVLVPNAIFEDLGENVSWEDVIKAGTTIQEELEQSEPYKNLLKILYNDDLGFSYVEYVNKQFEKVDVFLGNSFDKHFGPLFPMVQFKEVISDEAYKDFQENGNVSDEEINTIAKKLFKSNKETYILSNRQIEIYKAKLSEVDAKIAVMDKPKTKEKKEKENETKEDKVIENSEEKSKIIDPGVDIIEQNREIEEGENELQIRLGDLMTTRRILTNLMAGGQTVTKEGKDVSVAYAENEAAIVEINKEIQALKNPKPIDKGADETTQEEVDDAENINTEGDTEWETSPNEDDTVDVIDSSGLSITTTDNQEVADEIVDKSKIDIINHEFLTGLLIAEGLSLETIEPDTLKSMVDSIYKKMDAYNNRLVTESKKVKTVEAFYNSTKLNKQHVDKMIANIVKAQFNSQKIAKATEVGTEETTQTETHDIVFAEEEFESKEFSDDINSLFENLRATTEFSIADEASKQTIIVFPDESTKFARAPITEADILEALSTLKFNCKR